MIHGMFFSGGRLKVQQEENRAGFLSYLPKPETESVNLRLRV